MGQLAPQYTCEHIWWITHGLVCLAQPGSGVGIVWEWVTMFGGKGTPGNTADGFHGWSEWPNCYSLGP